MHWDFASAVKGIRSRSAVKGEVGVKSVPGSVATLRHYQHHAKPQSPCEV